MDVFVSMTVGYAHEQSATAPPSPFSVLYGSALQLLFSSHNHIDNIRMVLCFSLFSFLLLENTLPFNNMSVKYFIQEK